MYISNFDIELSKLDEVYRSAMSVDLTKLKAAIAGASESSIIAVGSGGSFTVASLLCNLHEAFTGRVSRPSTPLEIICNPTLAASSPVFMISAEGKNPDIIEALNRARRQSARSVHVMTNRNECPLMETVNTLTGVHSHVFELKEKDGYLATNSLIYDCILIARAYGELANSISLLPPVLGDLHIGNQSLTDWIEAADSFVVECVNRGAMTIVYSPLLKPVATDLESKLSEGALLHSQLADMRSYAHGRHLWLHLRSKDCAILALTEPSLGNLWENTKTLIPVDIPTLTMNLSGAAPSDLIAGLVAQMYLVASIANKLNFDVGKPDVSDFGRKLYYLKFPEIETNSEEETVRAEFAKSEVLGALWPSARTNGILKRARIAYVNSLSQRLFKAVIFDYDGTLCASQRKDSPPIDAIINHLIRLTESGVVVGIASGRGSSMKKCLERVLPSNIASKIYLGLYNGGVITTVSDDLTANNDHSEFLSHVSRIIGRLKSFGVPILEYKPTHPYQVSIRFRDGLSTEKMWFVIADALRQDGLDLSSMVKSKHSVDILAPGINKSRLIAHVIQKFKIDPYDILTIGDQGAWPGNDSALLEHRYSLSVDVPSRRLDRGWKLSPSNTRDVDATLWYLDRFDIKDSGGFNLKI